MIPYNHDTREIFVQRMADQYLHVAHRHHELNNERAMWMHLLYYAMAEDIYGTHWDDLKRRNT